MQVLCIDRGDTWEYNGDIKNASYVYVGDQYETDVVGARGVGINPIFIDRYDLIPEVSDCPRIHSLTELLNTIW